MERESSKDGQKASEGKLDEWNRIEEQLEFIIPLEKINTGFT